MLSPLYGQLSPLRVPTAGGPVRVLSADADANTYLLAVEAADGQELEEDVITAVETFVTGCKSDGIWSAIKASCILAGARTLDGALVPLVGSAPTNNNFVSGDYDRETGLKGNGTTKYLNSNRSGDDDPQNDVHISFFETERSSGIYLGYYKTTAPAVLTDCYMTGNTAYTRVTTTTNNPKGLGTTLGFIGLSRNNSSNYELIYPTGSYTLTAASTTPAPLTYNVFAWNQNGNPSTRTSARLAFYSIGESINLSNLKSRVSTLMTDLAAAIP